MRKIAAIILLGFAATIGLGCEGDTQNTITGPIGGDVVIGDTSSQSGDVTIGGGCCDGDEDLEYGNLCSVPSGTDIPDETCIQHGGFRECQPCNTIGEGL